MSGESLAKILFTASNVSFVLAVVCLVLAIVCFVKFKIPSVIGDLSGRTAKKSIELMRANNEKTGNKSYRPGKVNESRGKLTETMKGIKNKSPDTVQRPETGLLAENMAETSYSEATDLLVDDATGSLIDLEATASLEKTMKTSPVREGGMKMDMLEEIILIHTEEVIV